MNGQVYLGDRAFSEAGTNIAAGLLQAEQEVLAQTDWRGDATIVLVAGGKPQCGAVSDEHTGGDCTLQWEADALAEADRLEAAGWDIHVVGIAEPGGVDDVFLAQLARGPRGTYTQVDTAAGVSAALDGVARAMGIHVVSMLSFGIHDARD